MQISVGTFNLNNLFSRFNFQADIDGIPPQEAGGIALTFLPDQVAVRTFMGRLVKAKPADATAEVARRILDMDLDVLAVQEVEHVDILRQFNRDNLNGLYAEVALVEGNDPRMIDVGILSKLPIGPITSHQAARHPGDPGRRVFGRDLLQVEIRKPDGSKAFTLYNTHLKSHFVPHDQDPVAGAAAANARRRRQAEMVADIISRQERAGGKFILTGDMNDPEDSADLAPMLVVDGQPLVDGLAAAAETRPPKPETPGQGPGPARPQWTHRFNPSGPEPPRYELFDQIWLSQGLAPHLVSAHIDRRTRHGGDGSDHDPAWVVLDL
ncbi:endonuclease/exonuclease/phosphatase family protein [Oceanomicrobium pacificus]|uniref:Endonuclease/exonuclease/phosphatase family protein n=1 Tax=Oceanomicrobium pacificus TaxID=2692916 RepID=A0A6B0U0T1_9RHOB|nr:endonuclease/exonuclease/phosphatase family protein [Oceanomicrobium pacificus]MXU64731.1 endonuclease/exonuclease/phosphatase family protein [Oceanomicrobium pacificus]